MENGSSRQVLPTPPTGMMTSTTTRTTLPSTQPRIGRLSVRSGAKCSMNQLGFPDVDTDDIKLNWIPRHAPTSTSTTTTNNINNLNSMKKKGKIMSRTKSGNGNEVENEGKKDEEKSCSFWIKKLLSHRILWFLILMPVYVVFIIVTIIFSTSVSKGSNDPESYSPADTFFGITYILFMSTVLAFVLRYFCHKCDHENRQCTCPPEQLIHEVVRKQQNNPKRKFLERPQPFISKKSVPNFYQPSNPSNPVPQLV